ncbi:uncharacterized protein LOC122247557 isoform X2 [Penaeus japonicus]|uniref:uncharacterized protein LOC122247557 isoform X2 n=1 Tax=Penaeus japonicus TaxID=27405 RepID=UPI001C70DAB1|nr:uncharacterized protein LOC122247557 isoform X2 [Penaeus japonicus]
MDKLIYVTLILIHLCSPGLTEATTSHGTLQIFSSVNAPAKQITNGKMEMPFRECGYILCNVTEAFTNETTHLWDYYVDWELPVGAQDHGNVFVLANKYQMPRSYLVFAGFTSDLVGEYKCVLSFRLEPVSSVGLSLSMSDGAAQRDCSNVPA